MFIFIFVLVMIFLIIPFLTLQITIHFRHDRDDDQLNVTFQMLRFLRYRVSVPLIELSSQTAGVVTERKTSMGTDEKTTFTIGDARKRFLQIKEKIEQIVHLRTIVTKFLQHVSVTQLTWHTHIGLGDAAKTGWLVGIGWSLKYSIVAIMSKYMNMRVHPSLSIIPYFQGNVSRTSLTCMIRFRIGYAILAAIKVVKHRKKRTWTTNKVESC